MDANMKLGSVSYDKFDLTSMETSTKVIQSKKIQSESELKKAVMSGEHVSISEEQLIAAIERAIKAMQGEQTSLKFSIHDKTKEIMVKVINAETGDVIKEIPPEKMQDLVAKLWEMAGILIDERK